MPQEREMEMPFTMLGFDGLKKRGGGGKRRRGGSMKIRKGSKRQENACGCKIVSLKRKGRGVQPAIACKGTPMKKYVTKKRAAGLRGKGFCTKLVRPIGR
jgi:hypothetical protein